MATVTLKGSPVHTNGELPKVGTKAPNFILVDANLQEKSLNDFKGKNKIICTVPSLDTAVCALSAKRFNELSGKMQDLVVLYVSADLPFAQKRVCGADNLTNIISLSIVRSKEFAEKYGVLIVDGPLEGLTARSVLVLDKEDKVIYTELVPEIAQEPKYELAIKAVQEIHEDGYKIRGQDMF